MALSENRVPLTLRDFFFQDPFFKSSWDDFEKLRQEMMRESMEFWRQAEQEMKQMLQSASNRSSIERDSLDKTSASTALAEQKSDFDPWFFPRRWMLPRLFGGDDNLINDKMRRLDIFQDKTDNQVIRVKDDDSKFEVSLDTHGFRPDELKVNVAGDVLSVEAKHEEKSEGKFVARQFSRRYTLPEGCEPHRVQSNLSSDGILVVTAPKRAAIKVDDTNRNIPIAMSK